MIGFGSEKVFEEWSKAAVALKLVIEALDLEFGGPLFVVRLTAHTKFEKGVHAAGLAADVELRGIEEKEMVRLCSLINRRFFARGPGTPVCMVKTNLANFPSGARMNRPHVHVQIPFDWKANTRAFLREHGYTEGKAHD